MNVNPFKMRRIMGGLLGTTLILCGCPAFSQSLLVAFEKAKTHDAQYQASRKAFVGAMEKLPQARAGLLPTINVSANKNRQFGTASFAGADAVGRDVQSWSWNAQLTQPLVRWASWANYQQADAATRQAMAQFAVAEQDLILRVSQAYLDLMVAVQSSEVMRAQMLALDEQLKLAQRTYSVGTGTITDVHEAKAKWALSQAQSVASNNELEAKHAELEKILGEPLSAPMGGLGHEIAPNASQALLEWQEQAQLNSPQIKLQQAAVEVARHEVAKLEAAHLPTLDLVLSKGTNYNSGSLNSPADLSTHVNSNQAGLQLTIPLYAGGGTQSRVREALALEEKAQEELILARRTATNQVRQAFSGISSGKAQVEALKTAVEAGVNAVESNKIGFRIGTRIIPDVLNAEQQLYASMRDLSKARAETAMQYLKLKAAAGALTYDDLVSMDQALSNNAKTLISEK